MFKRVVSLLLCLLMVAAVFTGCAKKDDDDKGAYVHMYLTDMVYDLDPANAYINESTLRLVSLVFDNLFVLDENGKVKKSLAKNYEIKENASTGEYTMFITLNETCWNDGIAITANDVIYGWKRALTVEDSHGAASLLFDIKNARAIKEGDASIDDLGAYALNEDTVKIEFEGKIDYDQFLLNLTSYSLVPLREEVVSRTDDWAKKPATIVSSGPFRLRSVSYDEENPSMVLERNLYYYRDIKKDAWDKSVTPYRLIVDYSMTPEQIKAAYEAGQIFYVGDIPMALRGEYKDVAKITNALSTHSYFLNENALIRHYKSGEFNLLKEGKTLTGELQEGKNSDKLFANADVRRALSLAIDRDAIATAVVFGEAATGLVAPGIFDTTRKTEFRKEGDVLIKTTADMEEAKALLQKAKIDPAKYMFSISVAAYDEVHVKIAEMVCESWNELGFHVALNKVNVKVNDDMDKTTEETPTDIRDDVFAENFRAGKYEVAALDLVSYTADAYSVLSNFAKAFSGQGINMNVNTAAGETYQLTPHSTGYDSKEYNELMEDIFAEKNIKRRSALLHDAEGLLMEDMPVIPVIFNQNAVLVSKELSKVKATYYVPAVFTKAKLKNYERFTPVEEEE